MKWRFSRSNSSATRATIHKRIGVRESQRVELLRTPSFMTMLKMLTAWWANLFLTDLPVKWRCSRSNISAPERARTYYSSGLKALYESFLIYQVLCHHSKYSLSGGQNESRLGKHGKIPYTSTSRRTSPWNTPCYLRPLWHNGCQYVRSHHSKGPLHLISGWRDSPPNRPFYPWTSPTLRRRVTKTAITLLILVRLRWN